MCPKILVRGPRIPAQQVSIARVPEEAAGAVQGPRRQRLHAWRAPSRGRQWSTSLLRGAGESVGR